MSGISASPGVRCLGANAIAGLSVLALGMLWLAVASPSDPVAPLWPASGVAVAAVLLAGPRVLPGLALAYLCLSHLWCAPAVRAGVMSASAAVIACTSLTLVGTTKAWLAWLCFRTRVGDAFLHRRHSLFRFALFIVFGCPAVAAAIGTLAMAVSGHGGSSKVGEFAHTWWTWLSRDATSVVLIVPLLLAWRARPTTRRARLRDSLRERATPIEAAGLATVVLISAAAVFGLGPAGWLLPPGPASLWAALPAVIWASVRFGPKGATSAVFLVGGSAVWVTLRGLAPLEATSAQAMDAVYVYLFSTAGVALTLAAGTAEQRAAEAAVARSSRELEARVRLRTAALRRANELLRAEVAERERAEAEAKRQSEFLQAVFDRIPVLIALFTPAGEFRMVNRAWRDVLGWSVDEMRGRDMLAELYPDPAERDRARRFIAAAGPDWGEFQPRARRGGQAVGVRTMWLNVRLSDGSLICIGQDVTRVHEIQRQLRVQNALLTAGAEATIDGILAVSPEGKILLVNRRFRELWGTPVHALASGHDAASLDHAITQVADPQGFLARVKELYDQPHALARDEVLMRDGRVLDRFTSPLLGEDGTHYGRIWYFRDATELKRAAAELAEWKARYEAAAEASGQLLYQWDSRSDQVLTAGDSERVLGYSAADLSHGSLVEYKALLHPDDRDAFDREIERAREMRDVFRLSYRLRHKDGRYVHIDDHGRFFRGADGEFSCLVGFMTDVTQRVESQQRLAASERFARATVDALTAEIAILDGDGNIVAVNAAWDLFGRDNGLYLPGGGVGVNYLSVCDAAAAAGNGDDVGSAEAAAEGIRAVLRGERPEFYLEYACHSPEVERWFAMRVTRFDAGTGVRAVVAHENITGRHVAERLEREKVGLRDAVKSMEQVLGVVGHELRTPLAALRAISEFLLTDGAKATAEWDRFLGDMAGEVDRMAETVNNLLEAARLNSGRARWNWGTVDLRQVCAEATDVVRPLVDAARVELALDIESAASIVAGDAAALRRLVMNLLSNARKHTAAGYIRVTVRGEGRAGEGGEWGDGAVAAGGPRWVEVAVSDTGAGIPPEILSRLGEAFALNSGVVGASHVSGTGLGLAICKGIAAAHGGELTVSSVEGRGTTVTARIRADLPAAAEGDTVHLGDGEDGLLCDILDTTEGITR